MSVLSISLLGPFRATLGSLPLDASCTAEVQALLICLLTEDAIAAPETIVHHQEPLMALLWPGLPRKSAEAKLGQSLDRLRQAIPAVAAKGGEGTVPLLSSDGHALQIHPAADVELDLAHFRQLLRQPSTPGRLRAAVALYRGDFLCDVTAPDGAAFLNWAE